jgi:hypothetical protein
MSQATLTKPFPSHSSGQEKHEKYELFRVRFFFFFMEIASDNSALLKSVVSERYIPVNFDHDAFVLFLET